jgi:hypothetical protein
MDVRLSRSFTIRAARVEAFAEAVNLFNVVNILGTSTSAIRGTRTRWCGARTVQRVRRICGPRTVDRMTHRLNFRVIDTPDQERWHG